MATDLQNVLQLRFRDYGQGTVTLNVPDPKDNLTEAAVKAVMNLIIEKDVFSYDGYSLASPAGAKIIKKETTDVF